jgi:hypothetical protein
VLEAFHHVADMDVVALEVALEDHHGAVGHGAPGEVIDQQVKAHARGHAEHGGEAQRHAIAIVEHGLLGFHLGDTVEGDRVQRAFLGTELAALADAIAGIGDREDDLLVLGGPLHEVHDRILVEGLRGNRVQLAERRANKRGQRDQHVGLRHKLVQQAGIAGIAFDRGEVLVRADSGEFGRATLERVEHGHFMPLLQQTRYHGRADITRAARNQYFHMSLKVPVFLLRTARAPGFSIATLTPQESSPNPPKRDKTTAFRENSRFWCILSAQTPDQRARSGKQASTASREPSGVK